MDLLHNDAINELPSNTGRRSYGDSCGSGGEMEDQEDAMLDRPEVARGILNQQKCGAYYHLLRAKVATMYDNVGTPAQRLHSLEAMEKLNKELMRMSCDDIRQQGASAMTSTASSPATNQNTSMQQSVAQGR